MTFFSFSCKKLICKVLVITMMHMSFIQPVPNELSSYDHEKVGGVLQNCLGMFIGMAGIALLVPACFSLANMKYYPYSFKHSVIININKTSDKDLLKKEAYENQKKGIKLSVLGLLMVLGGWYVLSSSAPSHVA